MLKKRFIKEERGQSMALVALMLTVILGFAALGIDSGRVHNEQIKVQNATDMAALAAVNGFPKVTDTQGYAKQYADLNCDGLDVQVDYVEGSDTVTVTCSKVVPYTFGKAIGFDSTTVTATATAKKVYQGGGDGTPPDSKCYKEPTLIQHQFFIENGNKIHKYQFNAHHDGSWDPNNHIGHNQIGIACFNQDVDFVTCNANGFQLIDGDGTNMLTFISTYTQNKSDNIGFGDFTVYADESLEVQWVVLMCEYDVQNYDSAWDGSFATGKFSGVLAG